MDLATDGESIFAKYVGELTCVLGHAGRVQPLRDYCAGLLVAEGRKSVEPMAAATAPAEVSAQHQKLLHFVGNSPWSDERMLAKVRECVLPAIERHGPIEAWIIDDTSFPKQGTHSVGVHHQYCGQLGKQANCQVAVTLSIANHYASLPIAYRLYLPQTWAQDAARRKKAHVPNAVRFATKPQIALGQIRAALKAGVPPGVVLMDASYGCNLALRTDRYHVHGESIQGKRSQASAGECQGVGAQIAETCLAHDHLARRHKRTVALALCAGPGACLPDPGPARTTGRNPADRMAVGCERAHKILARNRR